MNFDQIKVVLPMIFMTLGYTLVTLRSETLLYINTSYRWYAANEMTGGKKNSQEKYSGEKDPKGAQRGGMALALPAILLSLNLIWHYLFSEDILRAAIWN